jgi:hypothetical protein
LNTTLAKSKKENIQTSTISKRTEENAILINKLNEQMKNYYNLEKAFIKLKSDNSALTKKIEFLKRIEKQYEEDKMKKSKTKGFGVFPSVEGGILNKSIETMKKTSSFSKGMNIGGIDPSELYLLPDYKMKGKVFKGSNLPLVKSQSKDQGKINELLKVIEEQNDIMMRQNVEINNLKKHLFNQ